MGASIGLQDFKKAADSIAAEVGVVDAGNVGRLTKVLGTTGVVLGAGAKNGDLLIKIHIRRLPKHNLRVKG